MVATDELCAGIGGSFSEVIEEEEVSPAEESTEDLFIEEDEYFRMAALTSSGNPVRINSVKT